MGGGGEEVVVPVVGAGHPEQAEEAEHREAVGVPRVEVVAPQVRAAPAVEVAARKAVEVPARKAVVALPLTPAAHEPIINPTPTRSARAVS